MGKSHNHFIPYLFPVLLINDNNNKYTPLISGLQANESKLLINQILHNHKECMVMSSAQLISFVAGQTDSIIFA